ncbi:MAG: hypothetical protein CBC39_04945 [Cellvibrionales bacterium TMED79]|nr:hypothetical protein [Halieaceae bacterium]OUV01996.1 MAG: hypothetical protein CBC39_04945 [Cellvibrionales bacterium TMED79]
MPFFTLITFLLGICHIAAKSAESAFSFPSGVNDSAQQSALVFWVTFDHRNKLATKEGRAVLNR